MDRMELRPTAPESETLLRHDQRNNAFPYRRTEQAYLQQNEPVRLTPAWEGTNLPNDTLNLKGVGMELIPPKDKWHLIYFTLLLHGLGTLTPWNMFITAKEYFENHKLGGTDYSANFLSYLGIAAQVPNFIFAWVNCFVQIGGDLTTRIIWSLSMIILIFVLTVVLAILDSSNWPALFYWITMFSVVFMCSFNSVFQNTVYGVAARLPPRYTGGVILGSNIAGTLTTLLEWLSSAIIQDNKVSGVYFFITGLFIMLICFDTYFALPLNRFYRYHEKVAVRSNQGADGIHRSRPPYGKILAIIWPQLFNVFIIFFVTLAIFPAVHSDIRRNENGDFFIGDDNFTRITCFLTFNVTAMLGSVTASLIRFPGPRLLSVFVMLRFAFFPFFLLCNYQPQKVLRAPGVYITNDWVYWAGSAIFGWSSGHGSSLAMMYVSRNVDPQWAGVAGMLGAAMLVSGITVGVTFSRAMPNIIEATFWNSILS